MSSDVTYRNNQCISIRSICGYEESLLTNEKCIFTGLQVGFLSFSCLPLGTVLVCLWKQTDSEQTDFAFDGEMTATEVCTSRKDVIFEAWKKYWRSREIKWCLIIGVLIETFRRICALLHVMHALHLGMPLLVLVFSPFLCIANILYMYINMSFPLVTLQERADVMTSRPGYPLFH